MGKNNLNEAYHLVLANDNNNLNEDKDLLLIKLIGKTGKVLLYDVGSEITFNCV